jgi:hypothetical protein
MNRRLVVVGLLLVFAAFVSFGGDLFILGTKNNSDAEFDQSDYSADFYPDTQSVGSCPKEINTGWYTSQYFHFYVDTNEVENGVTFTLDPAWNDSTGTLKAAIDVWTGTNWVEAGDTRFNQTEAGYIDMSHGYLRVGTNDMRCRAVSGSASTTVVTWDQIKCQTTPLSAVWRLGTNNGSDGEFDQSSFDADYYVESETVSDFPKELNTSWWTTQYIDFNLTAAQCQKAKILSFDVVWNNGSGDLNVRLDYWDGSAWTSLGTASLSSSKPGRILIPVNCLKEGTNEWRLVGVSGTGSTTAVVWDSIVLQERTALPEPVLLTMEKVLDTTLNYWLTNGVIHSSGLPLTAYKIGDRARYGYSNPTEWGYAIQGWVAAAQRGLISETTATNLLDTALSTMRTLQNDTNQFKYGLFYPYYTLTDAEGDDVAFPYHDADPLLPSGDCALLYSSVNVVQGWLIWKGHTNLATKAGQVKSSMNFTNCYFETGGGANAYIAHQINATNGNLSAASWNIYADEGGMVNFVAGPMSGSITSNQWKKVMDSQSRWSATWNGHTVKEAALYNSMFTWPQRPLTGFPQFGNSKERVFGTKSFVPSMAAHLDFAASTNVDYPGFSAAMTQTYTNAAMVEWVQGSYIPPNLNGLINYSIPHIVPHGLFVPACAIDTLDESILKRWYEKWVLLMCDNTGVWHPTYSQDPLGFEVVAHKNMNQGTNYQGADAGRYIFESLSQAYISHSLYEGVERATNGGHNWSWFAGRVPGYTNSTATYLNYAYPSD